jgi:hypothetical protein
MQSAILKVIKETERDLFMTNSVRYAAYRYFGFTYFAGKAYSGLA